MSKIEYNDSVCDTVIQTLNNAVMCVEDAVTELQAFLNGLPSDAQIDAQLNKVSKVPKKDCNGNIIDYVVSRDVRVRKRNQYVVPYNNAKDSIQSTKEDLAAYGKNIEEMNEKVRKLQSLIAEFEIKSNTKTETEEEVTYEYGSGGGGGGGGGQSTTPDNGDGKADLNIDTDGDGKPDVNVDIDGDGKADLNIDTNGDGKPDVNIDLDGDGKADLNIDTDNDGAPDINIDLDGDGKADLNIDTDNNGKPDLNIDLNGDGKADLNIDTDGDGKPDINIDIDGDGTADLNIDTNNDGKPDVNIDADGDGKVDPKPDQGDTNKPPKVDTEPESETKPETKPNDDSDLFNKDEADRTSGGFADNIAAGGAGMIGAGAIAAAGGSGSSTSTKATTAEEEAEALFAFLPGGASEESSDFMYRGLFDQSGSGDVGSINYQSLDGGGVGVAKGAAAVAAVGLGVSGVDAFATLNEQRKMEGDVTSTEDEKDEKKTIKTIISSGILGILTIAFVITVLSPHANIIAIILLGLAMAVSAIASSTGLKIGKYIGFGVLLVTSILTFILSSAGVISPVGYIVIFGSFVVLSVAAILLDLLKGMFNDKLDLVPILVAIAAGLLIAMFKVLNVINWIVFVVLIVLTVGGYFLYEKVIKNKLPDSEEDMAQAVTYAQVQAQPVVQETAVQADVQTGVQPEVQSDVQAGVQMEAQMGAQPGGQPVVQPFAQSNDQQFSQSSDQQFSQPSGQASSQDFDPRALYGQTENAHPSITDRINTEPQNPFAGYNPMNTSFSNAFKDDDNNNNNSGSFDGFM